MSSFSKCGLGEEKLSPLGWISKHVSIAWVVFKNLVHYLEPTFSVLEKRVRNIKLRKLNKISIMLNELEMPIANVHIYFITVSLKTPRNTNNTVTMNPLRTSLKNQCFWRNGRFLIWALCYSRKQVSYVRLSRAMPK